MIHIEKNQNIPENENIKVSSMTGDYADTDFIEYYNVANPKIILGAFQAQFVKYGSLVYRFNDPKELGEAILTIDPESTHSAADFVRMNNELSKQMKDGTLEPESLQKMQETKEEVVEEEEEDTEEELEEEKPKPKPIPISNEKPTASQELIETELENSEETLKPRILNFRGLNTRKKIVKKNKRII